MKNTSLSVVIIDEAPLLTLDEFSRAIHIEKEIVFEMVDYQFIRPKGNSSEEWRFDSDALRLGRIAASFYRDLEINMPGVALALELLDRIETLEHQLKTKD